jgi:hypothetical protein
MLTALTQVSIPSQIHFYNTCTALFSSTVAFAPSLHRPLWLRCMHTVTRCDTHHLFSSPLALCANLYTSWTFYSLLASPFPEHCGSICLSPCLGRDWHKGKPGGLMSGPSWVTMLLGAAAFCYIILEMMHASIWPETHEYDHLPSMLCLCIYDCACLWKIVLLYFLIDSSMLMSPAFFVFLYFTIQVWLMIQLIAGMKTVVKCPCPYSEIVSLLWHWGQCDSSLLSSNDCHGVLVSRLMLLVQAAGLLME